MECASIRSFLEMLTVESDDRLPTPYSNKAEIFKNWGNEGEALEKHPGFSSDCSQQVALTAVVRKLPINLQERLLFAERLAWLTL